MSPLMLPAPGPNGQQVPESPLAKISAVMAQSKSANQLDPQRSPDPKDVLVMCPPTYLDNSIPNNTFMGGGQHEVKEQIDRPRAMRQYQRTKHLLEALGVKVMEIPAVPGNQDQIYTANVAVAIAPYIILANYKADGRAGEVPVAKRWFEAQGYQCIQPPFTFEGEADLKRLNDKVYVGGFGQSTDPRALSWIEEMTGVRIIRVRETSEQLYHLDCSLMPINEQNVMVVPEGLDRQSLHILGQVTNLIVVPPGLGVTGVTNGINIPETKVYVSGVLQIEEPSYRKGLEWLNATLDHLGYVVTFLDTDSYGPSGADLSCTVMHLNFPPSGVRPPLAIPGVRGIGNVPPNVGNVPANLLSMIRGGTR